MAMLLGGFAVWIGLLGVVAMAEEGDDRAEPGKFSLTIADWQCLAIISRLTTQATYALNPREPGESDEFEIELEGLMRVQEFTGGVGVLNPAEIIAVSRDLQVTEAKTRLKANVLAEEPRESSRHADYSPVLPEGAAFRAKRVRLSAPPHRLEALRMRGSVLLAKQRKHLDLPAAVTESPVAGPLDVRLSISSMSIRQGRGDQPDMLRMTIDWRQAEQGPAGVAQDFAFVDQVFALDEQGRIIGGGRWTRGDPLNDRGSFKFEIPLPAGQTCRTVRIELVTQYSEAPFTLSVEDIFDPRQR